MGESGESTCVCVRVRVRVRVCVRVALSYHAEPLGAAPPPCRGPDICAVTVVVTMTVTVTVTVTMTVTGAGGRDRECFVGFGPAGRPQPDFESTRARANPGRFFCMNNSNKSDNDNKGENQ